MTAVGAPGTQAPGGQPWFTRRSAAIGAGVLILIAAQAVLRNTDTFPESWDIKLASPIKRFQSWVTANRTDNVVLANVLRPIGSFVKSFYEALLDALLWLPWFWLPLLAALLVARSGRWFGAAVAGLALAYVELVGLHEPGMQTIALMLICVVLCVAIGIPLGIWAGLNPRVERLMRPVLDALQSLPTTIYLVPAVLFFGIGAAPAAIATVAFGVPPMIRIAAHGIRGVPQASVEAGRIFGSSKWQLLTKVQAPQAIRSFVTGINQTIMMCLGMVVLAGLIGAVGLGNEVIQTLRLRSPGRGTIIGLAVVAVAIAFDRVSRSFIERDEAFPIPSRTYWMSVGAVLVLGLFLGRLGSAEKVPFVLDRDIAQPIDDLIEWIRDSWGGTLQSINDFIVRDVVLRIRNLLGSTIAWPVVAAAAACVSWLVRGWKLAVFTAVGLVGIGLLGKWAPAAETFAQLIVAVLIAMLVAVPIGIFVGRRPRINNAIGPVLDALQTFPNQIYAIPFIMVFAVGYVPGILATVLYAVPPGIRLTALAIESVSTETLEAATTFGASDRQRLWGVQVPLALRGIVLGLNQVIMMSMSMVIITGLIGGEGLGFLAVSSLITQNTGLGVEVGLSLLVMAIILDRLTEGLADRLDPAAARSAR